MSTPLFGSFCSNSSAFGFQRSQRLPGLRLLPKDLLVKTGPVDYAERNSRFFLGWISRQRFRMVQSQLPDGLAGRLLEIGYGSGVFLPELARHSLELFGVDIHCHNEQVARALGQCGVKAQLHSAEAENMPFPSGYFEVAIGVSCLEFISDLHAAAREIRRVLSSAGVFIVVRPASSKAIDAGFRLLTGKDPEADFQGRRE